MLPDYALAWLDDPDGGGRFTHQRDGIRGHDWRCQSLQNVWLPRKTGVTCISDLFTCDVCELEFFREGIGKYDDESCRYSRHFYCFCCAAKNPQCTCAEEEGSP